MQESAQTRSNLAAILVGLACGDAVGTTLEFTKRDTYEHITDMVGGGPFDLEPGQWTDDTSMALCLGESLHLKGFDPGDQMARYLAWMITGYRSSDEDKGCFDIGNTTRSSLQKGLEQIKATMIDLEAFDSIRTDTRNPSKIIRLVNERIPNPFCGPHAESTAGNGSIMRVGPLAIWGANRASDELARYAEWSSAVTHGAPHCRVACAFLTLFLVRLAISPKTSPIMRLMSAYEETQGLMGILGYGWAIQRYHPALCKYPRHDDRMRISSSGYVVDTLEAALWSVVQPMSNGSEGSFRQAVLTAANLGDDADTVAAVTGQIAGALYGLEGIPQEWRERLAPAWAPITHEGEGGLTVEQLAKDLAFTTPEMI